MTQGAYRARATEILTCPRLQSAKARAILSSVVQGIGAGGHDPLVVVVAASAGQPRAGGASSVPLLLAPRDAGVEGGDTRAAANARPRAEGRGHWRAGARGAAAVDGGQEHDERDEARGGEGRPPSSPHGGRVPSRVEVDVYV